MSEIANDQPQPEEVSDHGEPVDRRRTSDPDFGGEPPSVPTSEKPEKGPTALTDRERILRRVIDTPEDDTPRLVFADWLDEHGDRDDDPARAEFIRLQCEPGSDPVLARPRRAREQKLLTAHAARWASKVGSDLDAKFRRGFVDEVRMAAADYLEQAVRIHVSPVTRLQLLGERYEEDGVALSMIPVLPEFGAIEELTLESPVPDVLHPRSGKVPDRLRALGFAGFDTDPGGATAVLAASWTSGVKRLAFVQTAIAQRWVRAIRYASAQLTLECLEVTAGRISTTGAADLAQLPFPQLKRVSLAGTQLSPAGIGSLLMAGWMGGVEELDLTGTWKGDEVALAVAASPRVGNLRRLVIHNCGLTDLAAFALAGCGYLDRLEQLVLNVGNNFTPAGVAALRKRFGARVTV